MLTPGLATSLSLLFGAAAASAPGEVRLPLSKWQQMLDDVARHEERQKPKPGAAVATRRLTARFERGVLSGRLEVELEATVGDEPLEVPLIGTAASIAEVRLDGERAVAARAADAYAVLVARSGRHRAELRFAAGEQQDRFARAIHLPLPPAPVTRVSLMLPEADLEVQVDGGVVLSQTTRGAGTNVEAALGSVDGLSVRWQRRVRHGTEAREMEARTYVLASLREDVLRCETIVAYHMLAGEGSRLELALPPSLEVTHVTGDAVLQWTTELAPDGTRKLIVLLRYLVEDAVRVSVHTQMPRVPETEIKLVRPLDAVVREGFIAVEGRSGMEITVGAASGLAEVGTRELPRELVELSQRPLLFGYRYQGDPRLVLKAERNAEVDLTDAVVDELEAATVVVEQGLEITKLRLFVRNNTRQYLSLSLPDGATLTHALIDGTPFHPAVSRPAGAAEVLLVPLRQSERVRGGAQRMHRVRYGETVGGLALKYFNKVERGAAIMAANPWLTDARDLAEGQLLVIPRTSGGTTVEESSFVVELAYKLERGRLHLVGRQATRLPSLDLPVVKASWQFFFPEAFAPLAIATNFKQHSAVRYGPVERLVRFLSAALSGRRALAGESYANILKSRKAIFQAEQVSQLTEALASFPLVGERYRFTRVLLGEQQAKIAFVYLRRGVAPVLRVLAFLTLLVFAAALVSSLRRSGVAATLRRREALAGAIVVFLWLTIAYWILGIHRAMLWGANAGMALILGRELLARARSRVANGDLPTPDWGAATRLRSLAKLAVTTLVLFLMVSFPMLIGLTLFVALAVVHARAVPWRSAATAAATALALLTLAGTARAQEATVPLDVWAATHDRLERLRKTEGQVPKVVIGETRYRGQAEPTGLRLHLTLRAQLGERTEPQRVPVVGTDVVLLSALSDGRAVALERSGNTWEWVTLRHGLVSLEVDLLVPPSGRRGSMEYRFGVVPSPATELSCVFPEVGLSPQVTGAVVNRVTAVPGGTALEAVLGPVREIHVVGFHDVESQEDGRAAKLYAESQNLFSFGEDRVELFSVAKLTILYAPRKRFRIALPAGYDLVKADGEGAFQYTVSEEHGRRVLTGETAYGIRQRYEISLRLARKLAPGVTEVPLALPGLLDIERDSGFVAVEVPGKVSIVGVDGGGLRAIDVRELPAELIESAVTPIVRAFQYDRGGTSATARIARYPEKTLAAGGVDELRAQTVLTGDGRAMTDLDFSLRNNMQQYLALTLAKDAEVRSAFLDGEPIKPSRNAAGDLLLPLVRSEQGHNGLKPIRVQLVYESPVGSLGVLGARRLVLPPLAVPLSSLRWSIHLPSRYVTSRLMGDVEPQRFVKNAHWQSAPVADERYAPPGGGSTMWGPGGRAAAIGQLGVGGLRPGDGEPGREVGLPSDSAAEDEEDVEAQAVNERPLPAAGADASGAVSVRIDVPRSGRKQTYSRYWIAAGEPVAVHFRFMGAGWLLATKLAAVVLLAALLGLALWPNRPPPGVGDKRRRLALGGVGLVLAAGTAIGLGAATALLGVTTALALGGIGRGWWARAGRIGRDYWQAASRTLSAHLTERRDALAHDFEARRERSLVWALLVPGGTLAWVTTKLVVLVLLLSSLAAIAFKFMHLLAHV